MKITIGEKIVYGKVMEKEKAEEKYEDAISGGHSAVMAKENKQIISMNIGNVLPA